MLHCFHFYVRCFKMIKDRRNARYSQEVSPFHSLTERQSKPNVLWVSLVSFHLQKKVDLVLALDKMTNPENQESVTWSDIKLHWVDQWSGIGALMLSTEPRMEGCHVSYSLEFLSLMYTYLSFFLESVSRWLYYKILTNENNPISLKCCGISSCTFQGHVNLESGT